MDEQVRSGLKVPEMIYSQFITKWQHRHVHFSLRIITNQISFDISPTSPKLDS